MTNSQTAGASSKPRFQLADLPSSLVVFLNLHHIKELHVHREVVVYGVTALGGAFLNLLRRLGYVKSKVEKRGEGDTERWHIAFEGALNFLSVPQLSAELGKIPVGAKVDIDLRVEFMDHAAFETLHSWRHAHERTGGTADIDEKHETWYTSAESGSPRVTRG